MPVLKPRGETNPPTPHGRRGDHCCQSLAALLADLRREADETGMRWLTDLADRYEAGITP